MWLFTPPSPQADDSGASDHDIAVVGRGAHKSYCVLLYQSPLTEQGRERLKALFGALAKQSDLIARYGCPHGSLCQELGKRADGTPAAAELMREPVEWAERQFAAMGRPDARDLAVQVIARYQGTALLTSAFRDPGLMEAEARRVAQWIDTLD